MATDLVADLRRAQQRGAAVRPKVIHFRVDLTERNCTYYGTADNDYIETYAAVRLAA